MKLTLESAPIGTKAPAFMGGHWIKTERGWKWSSGATFPRPGGDWTGELIAPNDAAEAPNSDYSECTGNPASCPENEGYGCCKTAEVQS